MQLNETTSHAIHILLLLTKNKTVLSSSEISEKINLSRRYLFKITSRLTKAGFINSRKGPEGGYMLSLHPDKITLYDVIYAFEGPILLPVSASAMAQNEALNAVYTYFSDQFMNSMRLLTFDVLARSTEKEISSIIRNFLINEKTVLLQ